MRLNELKSLTICAVACVFLASPFAANAQGYGSSSRQRYNHRVYLYNRSDLKDMVDSASRESKSFRSYFEHNFSDNGHFKRYAGGDHSEHQGQFGQRTLQDTIQNLDEDVERLRAEVRHHGRSDYARELAPEITSHIQDVDAHISHVSDYYSFGRDRNWRYVNSELYTRWQDLRTDLSRMVSEIR